VLRLFPIVVLLALFSSGCGIIIQSAIGWSDEEKTRIKETHVVQVSSQPAGAAISRRNPGGDTMNLGASPLIDTVTYEVEVTTEDPNALGLALGGLIEVAIGAAMISSGDGVGMTLGGAYVIGLAGIPELLTALIYGLSGDSVKERKTIPESQNYTYTARAQPFPDTTLILRAPQQAKLEFLLDPNATPSLVMKDDGTQVPPVRIEPAKPVVIEDLSLAAKGWVIAVMDVEDSNASRANQAIEPGLVRNLGDQLRIFIAQHGVKTIDRSAQERALKDKISNLKSESFKECYDDSCQIELGKALAASHILRARITRFGKRCVLNTELIDLRAEVTMAASSAQGDCEAEGFLGMSEEVARKLVGAH
jgi:hypothetical protein